MYVYENSGGLGAPRSWQKFMVRVHFYKGKIEFLQTFTHKFFAPCRARKSGFGSGLSIYRVSGFGSEKTSGYGFGFRVGRIFGSDF